MTYLLTGTRQRLFLLIAHTPGITKAEICAFSCARGGDIQRINHHLKGLLCEEFIQILRQEKPGKFQYKITAGKGKKMLKRLTALRGCLRSDNGDSKRPLNPPTLGDFEE